MIPFVHYLVISYGLQYGHATGFYNEEAPISRTALADISLVHERPFHKITLAAMALCQYSPFQSEDGVFLCFVLGVAPWR